MMNSRFDKRFHNRLPALVLLFLIAAVPMVVDHFHNHTDSAVHHDCPVYQWESSFHFTFTALFLFIVVLATVRFSAGPHIPAVLPAFHRHFQRRAPPAGHSR